MSLLLEYSTVLLFAVFCSAAGQGRSVTSNEPPLGGATVEFAEIPNMKFELSITIELAGSDYRFERSSRGDNGGTGMALCVLHEALLKEDGGWSYKATDDQLVIYGWKDARTSTFYPVRKVTFESKEVPKELMPKVTNPRKKG